MKRHTPHHYVLILIIALLPCIGLAELPVKVAIDNQLLQYSGRRDDSKPGEVRFGYSGARVAMAFTGQSVGMYMDSTRSNWVDIYVDGNRLSKIEVSGTGSYYDLASGLSGTLHRVEVIRATECNMPITSFKGFALPTGARVEKWPEPVTRRIEFIGDSITCGYGIEVNDAKLHFKPETENFCDTYAWIAARNLKADYLVVARSGIGMVRNYNGPYEGNEDNMPNLYPVLFNQERTKLWDSSKFIPDVVCINLGTNDFSTTGVNRAKYEQSYTAFVTRLISQYPKARIVMLLGPMQNSKELKEILTRIADSLNAEHGKKVTVFEMSKAGSHGFGADYHPSQEQAKVNGAELTGFLSDLMQWPIQDR